MTNPWTVLHGAAATADMICRQAMPGFTFLDHCGVLPSKPTWRLRCILCVGRIARITDDLGNIAKLPICGSKPWRSVISTCLKRLPAHCGRCCGRETRLQSLPYWIFDYISPDTIESKLPYFGVLACRPTNRYF